MASPRPRLSAFRGGTPHGIGGLLQPARRVHQVGSVGLAREALEPAGRLFGLLRERALARPAATLRATLTARLAAPALGFLLLTPCQLLEPLHQLVDSLVGSLLLATLHRLVLVLEPIQLELEEVGKILGGRPRSAAAPSATGAHGDLDLFVRLLGPLELLQRALLGWQRVGRVLGLQFALQRRASPPSPSEASRQSPGTRDRATSRGCFKRLTKDSTCSRSRPWARVRKTRFSRYSSAE